MKFDLAAALQRVGDRVEQRVDRLGSVAPRQIRLRGPPCRRTLASSRAPLSPVARLAITAQDPNRVQPFPLNHAVLRRFWTALAARRVGRAAADAPRRAPERPLRPPRDRPRRPPFRTRARLAQRLDGLDAAPPEVTTSSTRQTRSPGSKTPSSRLAVPYSFASLRTIRNGRPEESEAAAASATAPSSGPASRTASGSCSRTAWPRSARRAGRAAPAASRSGTCRGSSSSGGPSGGRSRPRGRRARGARRRARPASTAAGGRRALARVTAAGARPRASPGRARRASRRRSRARPARGCAPRAARSRDRAERPSRRRAPTASSLTTSASLLLPRAWSRASAGARLGLRLRLRRRLGRGCAGSSSGRRRRARRSARRRSSPRSARSPSRTTKTLPSRRAPPRAASSSCSPLLRSACSEQLERARGDAAGALVVDRRGLHGCPRGRARPRPRSGSRSRSGRRVHRRPASSRLTLTDTYSALMPSLPQPLAKFFADRGTAPRGDDRLLRAALVRAAALPHVSRCSASPAAPDESSYLVTELKQRVPGQLGLEHRPHRPRDPGQRRRRSGSSARVCLLWTSLSLFSVLESAFNIVYGQPNRSFLRGKLLAVALMLGLARHALRRAARRLVRRSTCSRATRPGSPATVRRVRALGRSSRRSASSSSSFAVYYLLTNVELHVRGRAAGRGRRGRRCSRRASRCCRSTCATRAT